MFRSIVVALSLLFAAPAALAQTAPAAPAQGRQEARPQSRPSGSKVPVDVKKIIVDDGDTIEILWGEGDREVIRILGIDTPEITHPDHDLPYPQTFGYEALSFARGVFSMANKVEVKRAATTDPYGRTLGYVYVNDQNYSPIIIKARLAEESVSRYGDNGFPAEAAEVTAAAKAAGPLPFESPGDHRKRMRDVSRWLKDTGARAH
jgi:micrococcal nuclease